MIWIVLFLIIILVSAVLAFRSMKDYEEFPESLSLNALFFVGNPKNLSLESLKKLHEAFSSRKQFFSIERLNKGKERALVIFGPRDIARILPELNLLEIEDYLVDTNAIDYNNTDKKAGVNQTLTWLVEPQVNNKKPLHVDSGIKNLELLENQKFFIQIVCVPENERSSENFQSTIRLMVVDNDPTGKIDLAKKLKQSWETATGLNIQVDNFPEQRKFESFKIRSLVPREVTKFSLSGYDIFALVS